jgi:hypothetical protein
MAGKPKAQYVVSVGIKGIANRNGEIVPHVSPKRRMWNPRIRFSAGEITRETRTA